MFGIENLHRVAGLGSKTQSSIEKILTMEEQSSLYLKQEKFYEAFGLLKFQYELGSKIHFASVLVNFYVTLMRVDRADEADAIREELIDLLQEKFSKSSDDILLYSQHLLMKKKYVEAALFFQIFLHFFINDKKINPLDGIMYVKACLKGLSNCVGLLIENSISRKTVRNHVLPWMKKLQDLAIRFCRFNTELSATLQANCLGATGNMQLLAFDFKGSESLNKEAVKLLKKSFGNDASNHVLYGECLGNIGMVYYLQKRPKDAKLMFAQALEAVKKATDYSSYASKLETIKKYKDLLKE